MLLNNTEYSLSVVNDSLFYSPQRNNVFPIDDASPRSKPLNSGQEDEIWSRILEEVSAKGNVPVQGAVIILGNDYSGKSSLVSRVAKGVQTKASSALEHYYLRVNVEPDSSYAYQLGGAASGLLGPTDSVILPIWILDGKQETANLLRFIFPTQLEKCVLILCSSLDKPGNVIPELRRWYRTFVEQIMQHFGPDEIEKAKQAQIRFWQEYVEPIESSQLLQHSVVDGIRETNAPIDLFLPNDKTLLPDKVLKENCGAPLIVVITKSDMHNEINSDELDKLQYHIREFCLHHGAALLYTSSKEERNTQLLRKYIAHRIFSLPFTTPAYIVEKDSIFVPAGWDSEQKLMILKETLSNMDAPMTPQQLGDSYSQANSKGSDVMETEEEQTFLSKLSSVQSQADSPSLIQGQSPRGTNGGLGLKTGSGSQVQGENTALASFFNSLLKKDPGSSSSPKTSVTQPSHPNASLSSLADAESHFQKMLSGSKSDQDNQQQTIDNEAEAEVTDDVEEDEQFEECSSGDKGDIENAISTVSDEKTAK